MIKSIFFSLLLVCSMAGIILAQQNKPAFITEIERTFREKESEWKIERNNVQSEMGFFKQETVFRSGKVQAAVSITVWQREENAKDVFEATSKAFDNTRGAGAIKKSLPNLGDENYIWTNRRSNAWPTIQFRKGKVYVTVFAPSVIIAKRFAQHVVEQIPPAN